MKNEKIKVGELAPQFVLKDGNGDNHSLSDYQGQYVILYFYPKNNTPGCIIEARSFKKNHKKISDINAVVLGIGADSCDSHKKFADRLGLPFTLLSDPNRQVISAYGALKTKKIFGKNIDGTARTTVIVSPEQKILKIYEKVNPLNHSEEVLNDLIDWTDK